MKRIGLALSGGGFRASLYHLGMLRFLRDAGILPQVTHITSVSGGSIIGAHAVLNWERYTGSENEFDAAASEFLSFVALDVRNRIFRRFPLAAALRWPLMLLGASTRKMTRTGLLEHHYEKYLYGDTSLFELPEKPQLHLLATNLNEGCLCSFSRDGLLMARPQPGYTYHIERIHAGLATVAMAVAASSAYPGFFPPLELTGGEVGTCAGEFGRHAFTDGGVFDNLGVRMFRCLERPLMAASPLCADDFVDLHETIGVLRRAGQAGDQTPLGRLWQVAMASGSRPEAPLRASGPGARTALLESGNGDGEDDIVVPRLWEAMRTYQFYHDPLFGELRPADPDAQVYLRASRSGGSELDIADRLWLNRHMLEAAFRQATGRACFRRLNSGLDGVLVSDVGKPIEVQGDRRPGGVIRTALRASDILMDRVWQLENETFHDTPGFVFAPITDIVEPGDDPTALHPEIQRQVANIRTDMDRFSPLETSALIRHGYCVCRKACRARPDLVGTDLPDNPPWDPIAKPKGAAAAEDPSKPASVVERPSKEPAAATVEARTLQSSALRRIWSALPDYRDWISFVYVPILVPILILLPYFVIKSYQRSHRINQLVESLSQGSHDLEEMSRLMENASVPFKGVGFEETDKLAAADPKGFEILQDSRILDLRQWNPSDAGADDSNSLSFGYRRVKVAKATDYAGDNLFYVTLIPRDPNRTAVRFPSQELQPKLLRVNEQDSPTTAGAAVATVAAGAKECRWQVAYDFRNVPPGDSVDLVVEYHSHGTYLRRRSDTSTTLPLEVHTATAELTLWIMLPARKEYESWRVVRHPQDKPQEIERVKVVTEYLANDNSILAFKLLALKPGYEYEVQWFYR
jgi:predicted acylesterase/phospholipase RssA